MRVKPRFVKFLVRFIFCTGFFLSVFRFNLNKRVVEPSIKKYMYGYIISLTIVLMFPFSMFAMVTAISKAADPPNSNTLVVANTFMFIIMYAVQVHMGFYMPIFKNHDIMYLVACGLELEGILKNVRPNQDVKFVRLVLFKIVFDHVLAFLLLEEAIRPMSFTEDPFMILHMAVNSFVGLSTLFTTNILFMALLYSASLFRCINERVQHICMRFSQHGGYISPWKILEYSEEIEKLAICHGKVTRFVENLANMFSNFFLLSLFFSFLVVVSQVSRAF